MRVVKIGPVQDYLAAYKLLITFFNFVPRVAVLVVR